jgi:threonine aldolase
MGEIRSVIRAVTHLDVSKEDIETTISAIRDIARRYPER